jgi:stabilization protein
LPDLAYGVGAYRRVEGNLPELKCVNMWVEPSPSSEKGVILQSRPGLAESTSRGSGPIRGMFQQDGVFFGDLFVVSGTSLYRGSTLLGSISGNGPVSFAASQTELVVTAGAIPYLYNGGLSPISFPDGAWVRAVSFHNGRFIYIRDETHQFYWSDLLDASSIDPLDYASAESAPDKLLDVKVVQDELWLIGSETIEPWQSTGSAETPFIRSQGRLYRKGAAGTGCSEELDNSLIWVGNDRRIYRGAEVPQRISDHAIEERAAGSIGLATWHFNHQGHSFFCLRLDDVTLAYDVATGQWNELASYGEANFRVRTAVDIDGEPLFGDADNGTLWTFHGHVDAAGPLERRFTAAGPLEAAATINNLLLTANVGQTPFLSGDYTEPLIELRTSRTAGQTWTDWRPAPLGAQGEYRKRTLWRRLGLFDSPGFVGEFRCTDPVPLRVSRAQVNIPLGGRGR